MKIEKQKLEQLKAALARYVEKNGAVSTVLTGSTNCYTRCGHTCMGACYGAGALSTGY